MFAASGISSRRLSADRYRFSSSAFQRESGRLIFLSSTVITHLLLERNTAVTLVSPVRGVTFLNAKSSGCLPRCTPRSESERSAPCRTSRTALCPCESAYICSLSSHRPHVEEQTIDPLAVKNTCDSGLKAPLHRFRFPRPKINLHLSALRRQQSPGPFVQVDLPNLPRQLLRH
jgi:hypothetical protein